MKNAVGRSGKPKAGLNSSEDEKGCGKGLGVVGFSLIHNITNLGVTISMW